MPLSEDDIRKNEAEEAEVRTEDLPIADMVEKLRSIAFGQVDEVSEDIVLQMKNMATWNDLIPQRGLLAAWCGNSHTAMVLLLLDYIRGQNERIVAGIEKLVELAGKGKK